MEDLAFITAGVAAVIAVGAIILGYFANVRTAERLRRELGKALEKENGALRRDVGKLCDELRRDVDRDIERLRAKPAPDRTSSEAEARMFADVELRLHTNSLQALSAVAEAMLVLSEQAQG